MSFHNEQFRQSDFESQTIDSSLAEPRPSRDASPVVQDPNNPPQEVPIGTDGAKEQVSKIVASISDFDARRISKGLAISQIVSAFGFTREVDAAKETALQDYLSQLEQIE